MDDLISRKEAMSHPFANGQYDHKNANKHFIMGFESYKEWLSDLPPAEKTDKWIEKEICETRRKEEMQVAKCSNCKKYLTTPHIYGFNHYNYCPYCGAKM